MSETDALWKRIHALERFQERIDTYDGLVAGDILHNAVQLQGEDIDSAAPTNLQLLQYITSASEWQPKTLSVSGINIGQVGCSAQLTLTNNWQDVVGCTKTLTFETGDILVVIACFDFEMQYTSGTNDLSGALMFDTSRQGRYGRFEGDAAGERGNSSQIWIIDPGTGSKTFKLQAQRTTVGTGDYCQQNGTTMFWLRSKILTDES